MAAYMKESGVEVASSLWQKLKSSFGTNGHLSLDYTGAKETVPAVTVRQELLMRLLSTCLGLAVSVTISYFGIKWLMNALDPTKQEKKEARQRAEELMKRIGVTGRKLTEYELCIASNLVDPLSMVVSWEDIGGLNETIVEIQESVILPFRRRELFSDSSLLQHPKGVLLYGPPGCGKTMIAKATAKAAGARFINLQVSSLVDKWYGESQKRAEAVFSLALKLQPCIIFIDEIDSFLRSRTSSDHEATIMIKTQFMSFWDGLMTDQNCHIIIMGATNRPQDVDRAILRRMPCVFNIGLPNKKHRKHILNIILKNEPVGDVDMDHLAAKTQGFSGSDLRELCRTAALYRVRDFIRSERDESHSSDDEENDSNQGELRTIQMRDFERGLSKMNQSKLVYSSNMHQVELD